DHLVAVHRPFLQQGEDRGAHIATPCPSPRPATAPSAPGAVTESRAEARPAAPGAARTEGPEGGAEPLEVAPAALRAAVTVPVFVSVGAHGNHSPSHR